MLFAYTLAVYNFSNVVCTHFVVAQAETDANAAIKQVLEIVKTQRIGRVGWMHDGILPALAAVRSAVIYRSTVFALAVDAIKHCLLLVIFFRTIFFPKPDSFVGID